MCSIGLRPVSGTENAHAPLPCQYPTGTALDISTGHSAVTSATRQGVPALRVLVMVLRPEKTTPNRQPVVTREVRKLRARRDTQKPKPQSRKAYWESQEPSGMGSRISSSLLSGVI